MFFVGLTLSVGLLAQEISQDHAGQYPPESIDRGSRVYGVNCAFCHGPNGDSIAGVDLKSGKFRNAKSDEDLAKVIKEGLAKPEGERKDMAASVEGQTLNGKPDSAALTLRRTQIFSWLEPSMNPQMDFFQQTPPRISQIQFSDDAGGSIRYAFDRFMKTIFEDIAANEVGVVPDDNLRSYYVVQPIDRNSNEEILRQQFLTEGKQFAFRFGTLANLVSAEIAAPANNAWELALWKKYGIDREAPPAE